MQRSLGPLSSLVLLLACGGSFAIPDTEGCPRLQVSTDRIAAADARRGVPLDLSIRVANACDAGPALAVDVRLMGAPEGLTGGSLQAGVEAGQEVLIPLSWTPSGYEGVRATLEIDSDDPGRPRVSLPIVLEVDPDQDGDGADAVAAGGQDCADDDADRGPGASERDDGIDQDCDGLVDEDFVEPGDIVVTEIMASPRTRPDARQWIEVVNRSARAVDLLGWTVRMGEVALVVDTTAVLPPGERGVLARTLDAETLGHPTPPIGLLSGPDLLEAPADWTLTLDVGGRTVLALGGVGYVGDQAGRSLQRDGGTPFEADERPVLWCSTPADEDRDEGASPGAVNGWCPGVDHDGDGVPLAEDCDDTDPRIGPGRSERLDGIDQDCSGRADDLELPDDGGTLHQGVLGGDAFRMGTGDFNGDGVLEVATVSPDDGWSAVYDLEAMARRGGDADLVMLARSDDLATPRSTAILPRAVDVSGDGREDLVLGRRHIGRGYAVVSVGTSVGAANTWVVHPSDEAFDLAEVAATDADGDGVAEVLLGLPEARAGDGEVWLLHLNDVGLMVDIEDVGSGWIGTGAAAAGLAVGGSDIDDDGYGDLLVRSAGSRGVAGLGLIAGGLRLPGSGDLIDVFDAELDGAGALGTSSTVQRPVVADLDGDLGQDVIVGSADGRIRIWWDAGARLTGGSSAPDVSFELVDGDLCGLEVMDLDEDGAFELLTGVTRATPMGDLWGVYAWTPAGFGDPSATGPWTARLRTVDVDHASQSAGCGLLRYPTATSQGLLLAAPEGSGPSSSAPALWVLEP